MSLGRVFAPVPSEFLLIASTALLLTGFGLVMVLSATSATATAAGEPPYEAVMKQAVFAVVGIPVMFIASRLPISFWKRAAWPALIGAVLFQLLVFVPGLGVEANGNRNWIMIAGFQFQPAEFLKLGLALWMGYVLFRKQTLLGLWRHVFIPVVPVGALVIATVLAGQDLGTAMILVLIVLGALFFSGVKLRIFILPLIASVAAVAALAVTSPDRMRRIMSFLDPDCLADYFNSCYQPLHGIWGLAGGGIFGLGLGNSKEKYDWLPAAANDYIFAIVGEELGLIGCRRRARAVRAVRRRSLPRHPQDRRPVRADRLGCDHGLDRRAGAHQHRRRAARLPRPRRPAAVHVAGWHVTAVGARRIGRAARFRTHASRGGGQAARGDPARERTPPARSHSGPAPVAEVGRPGGGR